MLEFSKLHNSPDPTQLKAQSSFLVMNLLAQYCKFGTVDSLKEDSMRSMIQCLRVLYEYHDHMSPWRSGADGTAAGNPLAENRDIILLRRAHRVHLAKYRSLSVKARPFTAHLVCDHASKF